MRIIDLHTHILPHTWPDLADKFGYPGWINLDLCSHPEACCAQMMRDGRHFRTVQRNCWDPSARLHDMDRLMGPDSAQVLSTVPVMFSYWAKPEDALHLAQLLNDHIADVVRKHPSRFFGLGTIPLQDPDLACRELERCVRSLGLRGVQIGTHVEPNSHTGRAHDWNLSDPALFPVFQTAADVGAAVFVHPWDMMGSAQMEKYWLPWLVGMPAEGARAICSVMFGGVLERLPALRICFAHGGGSFPGTLGRIDHGYQARPDLCGTDTTASPRDQLHQIFVDSLTHDPDSLRTLLRLFTANRVALGSDYPFPLGEQVPGAMIAAMPELDSSARERLLSGSARDFLGIR